MSDNSRPQKELVMHSPRRLRFALVAMVALAAAVVAPRAAEKRLIAETDLFKFTWIADPQISPDGSTVAFVRVVVNEKEDTYETSIFAVSTSGTEAPRWLTSGTRDTSPRWAPDGKRLAFVRVVEKDGKTQPGQIYLLHMDGGEARPTTDVPRGADAPQWSPDGKTIAFVSSTAAADDHPTPADGSAEPDKTAAKPDTHKSDVKVITRAVYRANGNPGWLDADRHAHIWTVAVSDNPTDKLAPRQITTGDFDERGAEWSPDGSTIYFTSTRVAEPYYVEQGAELFSVPAAGGAIVKIAAIDGTIANVSVSPDGKQLAFVGTLRGKPIRSYSQPDLWVTDATANSTPRNLTTAYDFDISGGIGGDQSAPRGDLQKPIVWSRDEQSLVVVAASRRDGVLGRARRIDDRRSRLDAHEHRRHCDRSRGNDQRRCATGASDHAREQRAVQGHRAEPTRGALVHELRWQADSGLDSQAPRLRSGPQVPTHPRNSRRAAQRLRQHVHARVLVDGCRRLRRALHEPARKHDLRTGLRQHHPVPLPWRRLQRPDGGRRRNGETPLH
jgi:dipeptidyl aminopeptidase/acylaminoacyl peptidase